MARHTLSGGLVFTWDQTDITALLEAAPVLVAGADSAGRVAIFNRACETLTGFRRQDVLGRPFVDTLVPDAWQSRVRRRFADLTAVELAAPHRNPWRRCAGDEVMIEWRCFPVSLPGMDCIVGFGHDVTEAERSTRRLAAQHVVTQILADALDLADAAPRLLDALCRALDFDVAELWVLDRGPHELECTEVACANEADIAAFVAATRGLRLPVGAGLPGRAWREAKLVVVEDLALDVEFRRLDAASRVGLRSGLAFPVAGRDFAGVVTLFTRARRVPDPELDDVLNSVSRQVGQFADRMRAEQTTRRALQAAEETNRVRDQFVHMVSHELRQPLSAVSGWLRVLRAATLDGDHRDQALEVIERNLRLQTRMIDDLTDMSRLAAGKLSIVPVAVDLHDVVVDAVLALRVDAAHKGVTLVTDGVSVPVLGDRLRLEQVVRNLASNALKFTPPGGRVEVRVERDASVGTVSVSDSGEGIATDDLERVFDRYWQGDARPTGADGGLGLGLAIVKQLAHLHGGSVVARSDGKGRGATFVVTLPLRRP